MSMTFKQLQDEMITVPSARFKETQRASVKRWLNFAYAKLWNQSDWTFRLGTANVAVTAGSTAISNLPADFGIGMALYRADGSPINFLQARKYLSTYQGLASTGLPEDWTIIGANAFVGPISSETSAAYTLLYEKALTELVNDNDLPAIPSEYHYALIYGATTLGLVNENDFTWQFATAQWQEAIASMQQNYLDNQRGQTVQWGSWDDFNRLDSWGA